jgi:hypothetical protein
MIRRAFRFAVVVALGLAVVANVRLYSTNDTSDAVAQLRFLRHALGEGAGDDMQRLFPEGYFFSHVLYGLAWVEIGRAEAADSPLKNEAAAEARWALSRLVAPAGKAPFPESLEPPHGAFYAGWTNWLRGGIVSLQPADRRDADETRLFAAHSQRIAAAYEASDTPYLCSYAGRAWPADNVVAIASLRLHDRLTAPKFQDVIARWRRQVQERLDPATGLTPHRVDPKTGLAEESPHGCSQALLLRFLLEIDPEMGRRQYLAFRSQFAPPALALPGVREHPVGVDRPGDVDSGPLILGVSLSASTVSIAPARLVHDDRLSDPYFQIGEALGMPLAWRGSRRYLAGQLPVADAFLVYARTATCWTQNPEPVDAAPMVANGWRLVWHAVTIGPLLAALWLTRRRVSIATS